MAQRLASPRQLDLLALEATPARQIGSSSTEDRAAGLEDAAHARLRSLLAVANERLAEDGVPAIAGVTLRFFDHRLDAGRALAGPPLVIELNRCFLAAYPDAMLGETVAHELAHLVVFHTSPRRRQPPHGERWQHVMRDWFGVEPERTHRFDPSLVKARRQRRWPYRCGCREHELTTVRHNRLQRGERYLCRRCGGPLTAISADDGFTS